MSSHERELTILSSEGSVVMSVSGKNNVADIFTLKKKSEHAHFSIEDINVKPHAIPASAITYGLQPANGYVSGSSLQNLKDAVSGLPHHHQSIVITVGYAVPLPPLNFPEGQLIVTELTASLTHEKHAETVTTSVFHVVGNTLTDPIAEVGVLAGTLYTDYEEFDALHDRDIQKALKNADTTVASIVNSSASIDVKPSVFAQALAIHDLVDDLYGKLLEKAQPPERVDVVP
ncbi:MAG: hypothetical protein WBE79_16480 [Candidatus Cybelea sp.]